MSARNDNNLADLLATVRTDAALADLLAILSIKKKSELKKRCRSIIISQGALANLILTTRCGALPWLHQIHHRDFQPEHLHLSEADKRALISNDVGPMKPAAQKAARKISAMFDERRLLSGHLFFKADLSEWHLFYFDQRDYSDRNNHWEGGSHIHLINHLWPDRTAQGVWNEFCTGNPQIRGALHIRFQRRPVQPMRRA